MRSRIKPLLGMVLGVLALGAVASASASATTCHKETGANRVLCIESQQIQSPTEPTFESHLKTGTVATLETALWNDEQKEPLQCKTTEGKGHFHQSSGSPVEIRGFKLEFSACEFVKSRFKSNCRVPFWGSSGMAGNFGAIIETVGFEGEAKEEFGIISFSGNGEKKCPLPSSRYEIRFKASMECQIKEVQVEKLEQQMKCEAKKSNLQVSGVKLELGYEATLALSGENKGKKFSIVETT